MGISQAKSRGFYATPATMAASVSTWGVQTGRDRVLDPAVGHGVFLVAAAESLRARGRTPTAAQLHGVEVDARSAATAVRALQTERVPARVQCADFFAVHPNELGGTFDLVLGNPPYVRHHLFGEPMRSRALARASEGGVALSESADMWALYVAHAIRFLSDSGRLAFVLPSALLQADYARPIRKFLLDRFESVRVVTLVGTGFPGALVDVVLLLAGREGPCGLHVSAWNGQSPLDALPTVRIDTPHGAWTAYRQSAVAVQLVSDVANQGFVHIRDVAQVRIGVVTGANSYFVLSPSEARARHLSGGALRRMIVGPSAIRGARFSATDVRDLDRLDAPSKIVWLSRKVVGRGRDSVRNYIARGRRLGVHHRTKAAERDPWYFVDDFRVPDLFVPYMSHLSLRCAINLAGCSSTNLIHHITLSGRSASAAALAVAMQSSITQLSAEALARTYGGGVLKLEPSDAAALLIPSIEGRVGQRLASELERVDALVRQEHTAAASAVVDQVLTKDGILSPTLVALARDTLSVVRSARLQRGRLQRRLSRALAS